MGHGFRAGVTTMPKMGLKRVQKWPNNGEKCWKCPLQFPTVVNVVIVFVVVFVVVNVDVVVVIVAAAVVVVVVVVVVVIIVAVIIVMEFYA